MDAESGQKLSHYRLVERIGEGGMGVVWKAEDTVLSRTVAIKVLPQDVAVDDKRRRMFLDEARLAASLSDAHIAQVYELGREGDLDFIVMEHVDGKPLSKILNGKPLPPERVAELGLQVARGLARAHQKGLIHRDLKPGNVLVTKDGDVKIVDFGLATLFSTDDATMESATVAMTQVPAETGTSVAGTLRYMSPEQVRGMNLDARSDIFALGVLLYEMTTGQRPFGGSTPSAVAQDIVRCEPQPVHDLVRTVPLDLNRMIDKALARSPADRYQHTDDIVVDLRRLINELESGSSPSYRDLMVGLSSGDVSPEVESHPEVPSRFEPVSRRRFTLLFALAAAVLVSYVGLFRWHSPAAIDTPAMTTGEALPIGRTFLAEQGAVGSFDEVFRFIRHENAREFLARALSFDQAAQRARQTGVGYWSMRWYRPGVAGDWKVGIGGDGSVVSYQRTSPPAEPNRNAQAPTTGDAHVSVDEDSAVAIAHRFLGSLGWIVDELERTGYRVNENPDRGRTEHSFTWKLTNSELAWDPERPEASKGFTQVSVAVHGNEIGSYSHSLHVPDDFERTRRDSTADMLAVIAIVALFVPAVVFAIRRRRIINWRPPLILAVVIGGNLLVSKLNTWQEDMHDTSSETSVLQHSIGTVFGMLFIGAFAACAILAIAGAGQSLARQTLPKTLVGYDATFRGKLSTSILTRVVTSAYVLAFFTLGLGVVEWLLRQVSPAAFYAGSDGHLGYLDDHVPFLSALLSDSLIVAILFTLSMMYVLALAKRYLKSSLAAVTAVGVIVLVGVWDDVFSGDLTGLALVFLVPVAAFAFLRLGALGFMLAFFISLLVDAASGMFQASDPRLIVTGVALLLVAALPVGVVLRARASDRS